MKNLNKRNIVVWLCCSNRLFCSVLTTSRLPYVILCPDLMTVQISKEKVSYTHKELVRRSTFVYVKLLSLKSQ